MMRFVFIGSSPCGRFSVGASKGRYGQEQARAGGVPGAQRAAPVLVGGAAAVECL
jgi:hypothetical protein